MSLKTILDLPALVPGAGTHGVRVQKPPAPAARCALPAARGPGARGRRGAAGPTPSPAPCAPPSAGEGGTAARGGLGGEAVSCFGRIPRTSTGCKCPGSRREGGAGGIIAPLRLPQEPGASEVAKCVIY